MKTTHCSLCEELIEDYSAERHQLEIARGKRIAVCSSCTEKLTLLQQKALATSSLTNVVKSSPTKKPDVNLRLPRGAQHLHTSVKGHGKRPMRRY